MLPMHVLKGKKLPGHMGHKLITVQNLEIIEIDLDKNIILVKGNIPGPKKSLVIIKSAVKNEGKVNSQDELITYVTEEVVETEPETTTEEAVEETTEAEEVKEETTEEVKEAEEKTEESSQE